METPLHVRVAEALGWFGFQPSINGLWPDEWRGIPPRPIIGEPPKEVPRYDTDWSATGPLIERFRLEVIPTPHESKAWLAATEINAQHKDNRLGQTPLIAVCNLILALSEAGKLAA